MAERCGFLWIDESVVADETGAAELRARLVDAPYGDVWLGARVW